MLKKTDLGVGLYLLCAVLFFIIPIPSFLLDVMLAFNLSIALIILFKVLFEKELGYVQPSRTPFVGSNFNVTRAGIHADGLLKNEEIYNIFDTGKFLNRPPLVSVSNTSGLAGIAHWINSYYHLPKEKWVDKNSDLVKKIKVWVDAQYEDGRVTVLTDSELVEEIGKCCKELNITI